MSEAPGPISLAHAKLPLFAGVDVGGTNIKIGLVDDAGCTLEAVKIPTETEQPPEEAAKRMGAGVRELVEQVGAKLDQVARCGLATPGPIDIPTGYLVQPGNLPNWWNFPIRDRVSHHAGMPVTFANDANAASYGEYWRGAGQQHRSMILLTLGTGIGGGIIVDDLIIEGSHGCGSECGHIIIDPRENARRDSLDKSGSLESYCGAYAIVGRTNDALAAGRESSLRTREADLTPLAIAEEAEHGDELAREIIFETARYLAIGIVTLIHTIDPDSVVLGGAMTFGGRGHSLGEEFIDEIRREARQRMLQPLRDKVAIEFATIGGDAGFIGAAGMARLEHRKLAAAS